MKKSKKLFPAIAMLMISAILLTTASYAWFTMSRQVTATGMNVTVTAPTNLLISNAANGTFSETATTTDSSNDTIAPASSIDGATFYAVKDGTPISVADGATSKDGTVLEAVTTGYYKDFYYWVKTEGESDVEVGIKQLNVTSTNKADSTKAVRAAVITADNDTAKRVAAPTGAEYFTSGKAVNATKAAGTAVSTAAVNLSTAITDVVFTAPEDGSAVPVTIRVWFEGEDKSCTAAKSAGSDLDVEIVLSDSTYTA